MPYIGRSPQVGNYSKLDSIAASFNTSDVTFNLTVSGDAYTPGSSTQLIISIDGVIQEPEAAYTVSGSTITFTSAPASGATFYGIGLGNVLDIGTPSDGTVTASKLTASSVTAGKIATGGVSANTQLASGVVTTHALSADAVTTAKIVDDAVTYGKIAKRWIDVSVVSPANTTISVGNKCLVGTANGTVGIVLPISSLEVGDEVEFIDKDGFWSGNNATVHSGSGTILIDTANNFVLNTSNTSVRMIYTQANQWKTQVWQ